MRVDWPSEGLPTSPSQWHFIAELITTRDSRPRVRLGAAQGFGDAGTANQSAKARLRALIDDLTRRDMIVRLASLRLLPAPTLETAEVEAIVNVATGLALAAAELDGIFRRNAVIDFAELTFAAQRVLGDADAPDRSRAGARLSDQASVDRRVPGHFSEPVSPRRTTDSGMAERHHAIAVHRR